MKRVKDSLPKGVVHIKEPIKRISDELTRRKQQTNVGSQPRGKQNELKQLGRQMEILDGMVN